MSGPDREWELSLAEVGDIAEEARQNAEWMAVQPNGCPACLSDAIRLFGFAAREFNQRSPR